MVELNTLYEDFINSYKTDLTYKKIHENTIEIGTPFTIGQSFVSVFVTYTDGKYTVHDGGWIAMNEYLDIHLDNDNIVLSESVMNSYKEYYDVYTDDSDKYYATILNDNLIEAIFRMTTFIEKTMSYHYYDMYIKEN